MPAAVTRPPVHPALAGVVSLVWCARGRGPGGRERVIPTGDAHLAWRLGAPIGLADGRVERWGVLGGPRASAHLHDTAAGWSIGVMLHPGALPRLTGEAARAAAGRHTGLDDLWGPAARALQDALDEAPDAALDLVEAFLAARVGPDRRPDGLSRALAALSAGTGVEAAARRVGRSPRSLGAWFEAHVGLSPQRWATVRRVRRAMDLAATEPDGARVAALAGYADHSHLCRDFRAVTGVTMGAWRAHVPGAPSHVPEPTGAGAGRGPRPR